MNFVKFLTFIIIGCCTSVIANENPLNGLDIVATEHELLQYREGGQLKGSTIDILKLLLQDQKTVNKTRLLPWARAFHIAKNQPNTLVLSIVKTKEREPYFYWITKVRELKQAFISLKGQSSVMSSFEQAKNKLTVVVRDSYSHKSLLNHGFEKDKNLYVVTTVDLAISLLLNKKVELFYSDPGFIRHYFEKQNLKATDMVNFVTFPETHRSSYIALNKQSSIQIRDKLMKAHQRIKNLPAYHLAINN